MTYPGENLMNYDPLFYLSILQCDQIRRIFATLAESLQIFWGVITIWQNFGTTLAFFIWHWEIFHSYKWPNVEK